MRGKETKMKLHIMFSVCHFHRPFPLKSSHCGHSFRTLDYVSNFVWSWSAP